MGFYDDHLLPRIINVVMNTKQNREIRARVCAGLTGEVVEIGFGTGHNLPYLPSKVTHLKAVEPSALAVRLAGERIAASAASVELVGLDGQQLPIPDGTADTVLCTWSLCTIPDPIAAVRAMRRVLRPGGQLRFVEHGLAPDEKVRRWQARLNGVQQRLGGGCNLNRDMPMIVESAGMTITRLDTYYVKGEPKPYSATYEGTAVRDMNRHAISWSAVPRSVRSSWGFSSNPRPATLPSPRASASRRSPTRSLGSTQCAPGDAAVTASPTRTAPACPCAAQR